MSRRNSFVLIFICLLLYFDSTVRTKELKEIRDRKKILKKNRNYDRDSVKYPSELWHESRIERLIADSEKSLRDHSPKVNNRERNISGRREKSRHSNDERRFETARKKTNSTVRMYKSRENQSNKRPRLFNPRKSLSGRKNMLKNRVKPIRGCSENDGKKGKGYACIGARSRKKRQDSATPGNRTNKICAPALAFLPSYLTPFWYIFG